ncbi:MAG: aminotransferase class V-fold PLP-dependent enzyme [Ardenticatenaceae bacterium]
MNTKEFLFPELAQDFLLRPDVTFLNHGSFGACPRPVFERYQAWQRELEAQPVEFLGRRLTGLLAEARARLAAYVGTDADNVVFVPNATKGTNIVARSLDLQPGDEVLGTNHEYGAAERTWRFVCRQRGARYLSQTISLPVDDPDAAVEQFWAGVTERTRVIFLSHITSPTALILPVEQICQRAKAAGILTVIDGAHAPGQIDLNLDQLGADFYTGNCHKWLCAPKGSGFLYAPPERQPLLQPLVVSWGWESRNPGPSPFIDYLEWVGTNDPAAYLSVPAAIDYQTQHNWHDVRRACHQLGRQIRHDIQTLTGQPHIAPDSQTWWMQLFALPIQTDNPAQLKERLWDEHQIEVPIITWEEHTFVRLSLQAYNAPQDGAKLLEALKQLL